MKFTISEAMQSALDRMQAEIAADPAKAERRQRVLTCVYEGHVYPTEESACSRCGAYQVPINGDYPVNRLQTLADS